MMCFNMTASTSILKLLKHAMRPQKLRKLLTMFLVTMNRETTMKYLEKNKSGQKKY